MKAALPDLPADQIKKRVLETAECLDDLDGWILTGGRLNLYNLLLTVDDCNADGIPDSSQQFDDCNSNGIPDPCEPDCNINGIPDDCEPGYTGVNCNGVPYECHGIEKIFVDIDAPGPVYDGKRWETAFLTIPEAQVAAQNSCRAHKMVLVAQGTYYPDTSGLGDPREATFELFEKIPIYGGYAVYGADNEFERKPEEYKTILSGDIGVVDDDSDNCYHVVTNTSNLVSNTVVDGFYLHNRWKCQRRFLC